jgi:UDP-glucose 4-epimerase
MVTGVARDLGAHFARRISGDPAVDKVVGVDVRPPRHDLHGVAFVRVDIRDPAIGQVLVDEDVDTVVHLNVSAVPAPGAAASSLKETNVIGTMQLLAACQRAAAVRKLVVKSATAVYGCSPRDPAMFTEGMGPRRLPSAGFAKDSAEVEGYLRGFCRRRPDVAVTTVRLADLLTAGLDTAMSRYLKLPVLPTVLGFDPRLQFLHSDDAYEVLQRATVEDVPGTYNVAGDGVLMLSQVLRRTGTPSLPVPAVAFPATLRHLSKAMGAELGRDAAALLTYGRGVDTTALRTAFGYEPAWSTAETLSAFLGSSVLGRFSDGAPAGSAGASPAVPR